MADTQIIVRRQRGFTAIPNEIFDGRLSLKAVGLMALMLSKPPSWSFTVSGLAKVANTGRDAIRSALKELEEVGYLIREQKHKENGQFGSSIYILYDYIPAPMSENPTSAKGGEDRAPLSENPTSANTTSENSTQVILDRDKTELSNTPLTPQGGRARRKAKSEPDWKPERFARFWAYYPRGESKQAAINAWDKLKPSDELIGTMAQALVQQMRSEAWQRGFGIPYASTWLNGRRWEDEAAPAQLGTHPHPEAAGAVLEEGEVYLL